MTTKWPNNTYNAGLNIWFRHTVFGIVNKTWMIKNKIKNAAWCPLDFDKLSCLFSPTFLSLLLCGSSLNTFHVFRINREVSPYKILASQAFTAMSGCDLGIYWLSGYPQSDDVGQVEQTQNILDTQYIRRRWNRHSLTATGEVCHPESSTCV